MAHYPGPRGSLTLIVACAALAVTACGGGSSGGTGDGSQAGATSATMAAADSVAAATSANTAAAQAARQEAYRPQFQYTPARNWMNDPNGLVYYRGEYHLFYQYNPNGDQWGDMSWGHAVSPDLLHWTELNPGASQLRALTVVFQNGADTASFTGQDLRGLSAMPLATNLS
jgi:hypothetical protein